VSGLKDAEPPAECDLAVIGGGILGIAVARELLTRRPGARLCVLEAEGGIGRHQTGRSSGMIHAGIYYRPGSLKARLCVEGAKALYEYCEERQIPHLKSGKLVVATTESELAGLAELERRGKDNGVPGLVRVNEDEIAEIEPAVRGLAALHSPATGAVDFVAVAESYAADVAARGGTVHLGCTVADVKHNPGAVVLRHARGTTRASAAVFCDTNSTVFLCDRRLVMQLAMVWLLPVPGGPNNT